MMVEIALTLVAMEVEVVNDKIDDKLLNIDAKSLAIKMESFLKSKDGTLYTPITLKNKRETYYWSIMEKKLCLLHPKSEMYLIPWKETEKGELYVYTPYNFYQTNVFIIPKDEIIILGFN